MILFAAQFQNEVRLFFRGTRIPTLDEAVDFCREPKHYQLLSFHFSNSDGSFEDFGDVIAVEEITRENAEREPYKFGLLDSKWPIFTPNDNIINVINFDGTLYINNATANRQIHLTAEEARAVFLALELVARKEDLRIYLESTQNANGNYWIGGDANVKLSKEELDALVDEAAPAYSRDYEDNNDWNGYAANALETALTLIKGGISA